MKYNIKAKQVDGFASKLEWHFSNFLKEIQIEYIYEYKTFKTKVGRYTPDFYLYEMNVFVEIKPFIPDEESYLNLLKQFSIENKTTLIIITPNEDLTFYYGKYWIPSENPVKEEDEKFEWESIKLKSDSQTSYQICECPECNNFHWIQKQYEWFACPKCGYQDKPYHSNYLRYNSFKEYWSYLSQESIDRRK